MPNRYALIALGIGAYLAFAFSTIPASTVYRLFAPEELRLAGIDGTVWSGSAELASAAGLPLQDVRWSLDALPLLVGRLSGRVDARLNDGFVNAAFAARPSAVVLSDLTASTRIAALRPLLPLEGAEGVVSLTMSRVELEDGWPTAAVGQAKVAQLAVPPLMPSGGPDAAIPLGDYELVFNDTGGAGIEAEIRDTGGPLEVAGVLALDRERNYRLEGLATARSGAPRELVQGLELLTGGADASGKHRFSLMGSL